MTTTVFYREKTKKSLFFFFLGCKLHVVGEAKLPAVWCKANYTSYSGRQNNMSFRGVVEDNNTASKRHVVQ
jgi:hypothetical protein